MTKFQLKRVLQMKSLIHNDTTRKVTFHTYFESNLKTRLLNSANIAKSYASSTTNTKWTLKTTVEKSYSYTCLGNIMS